MSLGLDTPNVEIPPRHKSAGTAFLLSFLLPGSGQLYCGNTTRGWATLGFWLAGALMSLSQAPGILGLGVVLMFALWTFAFLDAYFSAREINAGVDLQIDGQNPRVAAVLNSLTAGFGYFYLTERRKGILVFVGMQIGRPLMAEATGLSAGIVALLAMTVQLMLAADAWRIAREHVRTALGPEVMAELPAKLKISSRLPVYVPVALAFLAGLTLVLLAAFGAASIATKAG